LDVEEVAADFEFVPANEIDIADKTFLLIFFWSESFFFEEGGLVFLFDLEIDSTVELIKFIIIKPSFINIKRNMITETLLFLMFQIMNLLKPIQINFKNLWLLMMCPRYLNCI